MKVAFTGGVVVSEQLDVVLFGEVFEVLRNDAARRLVHLIDAWLHLPMYCILQY